MGKLKVLILGDGLLGSEIYNQTGWDVISRKKNNIDVLNFNEWSNSLFNYNIILNCIANTDTYSDNQQSHWDINYKFVYELINYCNFNNKKLIHISTDYLYTNSNNDASENDIPVHNKTWYGYTKLLSDGLVQLICKNYLICRCTHKPNPFPFDCAWIDQVGNFDYVNVISDLIIKLIKLNSSGLYNVGTETKTMFELASKTKDVNKIFSPLHIPKNTSMDIDKLNKTISNDKY
jgi:dTDP-4-dehydrorhamnose reductase